MSLQQGLSVLQWLRQAKRYKIGSLWCFTPVKFLPDSPANLLFPSLSPFPYQKRMKGLLLHNKMTSSYMTIWRSKDSTHVHTHTYTSNKQQNHTALQKAETPGQRYPSRGLLKTQLLGGREFIIPLLWPLSEWEGIKTPSLGSPVQIICSICTSIFPSDK